MHIGFLGLGNMGGPMAHNLLKAGHQLYVFDVSATAVAGLTAAGAQEATSAGAIAKAGVEVIITMLPAATHVREVYLGDDGLLANVQPGVLLIDSSTIDPMSAREVAAAAAVANNMLLGISMIGAAEAMSLGVALGMDARVLAGVINSSSGRCWSSEIYNPFPGVVENSPAARGYSGGFGTDLMLKDLGLASEAAKQVRQPVILGALAQQLYQAFSMQGNGMLDFSAIIKLYRQEN